MNRKHYARSRPILKSKSGKHKNEAVSRASHMLGALYKRFIGYNHELPWELSAGHCGMFEINPTASLQEILRTAIDVEDMGEGHIKITIGELNPFKHVQAPAAAGFIHLKLFVVTAAFTTNNSKEARRYREEYVFPYSNINQPQKEFIIQTQHAIGHAAAIFIALEFNTGTTETPAYVSDPEYLPAAVVAMGKLTLTQPV